MSFVAQSTSRALQDIRRTKNSSKTDLPKALQWPSRSRRAINNLDEMLRLPFPPRLPLLLSPPLPPRRPVPNRARPVRKVLINLRHKPVRQAVRRPNFRFNCILVVSAKIRRARTSPNPILIRKAQIFLHNKMRFPHETHIDRNQIALQMIELSGDRKVTGDFVPAVGIEEVHGLPLRREAHP